MSRRGFVAALAAALFGQPSVRPTASFRLTLTSSRPVPVIDTTDGWVYTTATWRQCQ